MMISVHKCTFLFFVALLFVAQGCTKQSSTGSAMSALHSGAKAFSMTQSLPSGVSGIRYFVSPNGSPGGDGSINNPLDIVTALGPQSPARPGDIIFLRGGKYGGGQFNSVIGANLVGTPSAPIIVRNYPGEEAIIDAWLQVGCCDQNPQPSMGAYVWFWGLEFASYNPDRTAGTSGPPSYAAMVNHAAADTWAPGTKFINNIVHDTSGGLSLWTEATDAEAFGNIIYDVGGQGPDRGHGHGLYLQNNTGVKHINDNIIFDSFDMGLHSYGTSTSAYVRNFVIDGNVVMNSGAIGNSRTDNLIFADGIGGPDGISVTNNILFHPPSDNTAYNTEIGWVWSDINGSVNIQNNDFIGGFFPFSAFHWNSLTFQNNRVYGTSNGVLLETASGQSPSQYSWNNNSYYGPWSFDLNSSFYPLSTWQSMTGLDSNSSFSSGAPAGVRVIVRPNAYEQGRANVYILNWDMNPQVAVDLSSSGLAMGQSFAIIDAQNYPRGPIATGTYDGSPVMFPMTGLTIVQPNGSVPHAAVHTAPLLGTFIVVPTSGSSTMPTPPPTSGSNPTPTPMPTMAPTAPPTSSSGSTGGLAARYSFDAGISGSMVTDDSGDGLSGSVSGNVTSTQGVEGQGISLDGISGQINVSSDSRLALNNDLTLAAFVRTTNTSQPEAIMSRYDASANETGYILRINTSGHLELQIGGINMASTYRQTFTDSGRMVNDGQWHHVAAVISLNSGVQFYIDGAASSFQSGSIIASSAAIPFEIGVSAWYPYGNFFSGSLDEVDVFNRALSSSEISSLASGTSMGSGPAPMPTPTPAPVPVTQNPTPVPTPMPTAMPTTSASGTALRINCGGSDYVDGNGHSWLGDTDYVGGQLAYTGYLINGTNDLPLYRSGREGLYDDFSYQIPLANGNYQVNLGFAEVEDTAAGQRVFNVSANGSMLLSNFDILQETQPDTLLIKSFQVQVSNGMLNLSFIGVHGRGLVNSIELIPVP